MHVQALMMSAVSGSAPPAGTPFVIGQTLGTIQTDSNDFGIGFRFVVGVADITVTDLGRWKVSGDSKIHFLAVTNDTTLATITGASVNVDMSNAADPDGYVYAPLAAPVVLTLSTVYRIFGAQEASHVDQYYNETCVLTTTADASLGSSSAAYAGPDFAGGSRGTNGIVGGVNQSYGPVNFKYHL